MSRPHVLRRLAVTAVASATALAGVVTQASAAGPSASRADAARAHHATLKVGANVVTAAADLTPSQMVARINTDRGRYGVPALTLDTTSTAALNAHAHYIALNLSTDPDFSTEESNRPGYTAAGAEIAPYATAQSATSWTAALSGWLSDPYFRDVELLEQTVHQIGFGADGNVRVYMSTTTGQNPTGYPRTYPNGYNNNEYTNGAAWLAQDYGCTGTGFPVSAAWDYTVYGQASNVSGALYADGVQVPTCVANVAALGTAQAAIVPATPLKAGTHYTGRITATLDVISGGTQTVTQKIDFTTAAAATGVAGDQTGDGAADLFAVNSTGQLWFFKGSKTGAYGHAWQVGQGWGSFNWLSIAGDIDKDGRTDLIGRTTDGRMWLYYSMGMGRLRSGGQVGYGFQGLAQLTVVGDMDHNGVIDLVGRTADAKLRRYNLGTTITGGVDIGSGWGGMTNLIGEGSFNGDVYDDIIAIGNGGLLYVYYSGPTGRIIGSKQVGAGWTGWTALFVPGDHNGDGLLDMTGRDPNGVLYSYRRVGNSWDTRVRAGAAFGSYRLLA